MSIPFAFDTSSLISLGYSGLYDEIINTFNMVTTGGVIKELQNMMKIKDENADIASEWLNRISRIKIIKTSIKEHAEDELFDICTSGSFILVIDDIKAVRRFGDEIKCIFSPHVIYVIFRKGLITRSQALISLDLMKENRDWRSNIIAITGILLFDDDRLI